MLNDFKIELLDTDGGAIGVELKGQFEWVDDGNDNGCVSVEPDNTTFMMRFCCANTGKFTRWISAGVNNANQMAVLDAITTYHSIDLDKVIDEKYRPILEAERDNDKAQDQHETRLNSLEIQYC